MARFTWFLDQISEWTNKIFKWGLALLMLLIVYDVVTRYVFNSPTIWGMDVQVQVFAIGMMIGCNFTLLRRGHVMVDLFTVKWPLKRKMILEAIMYVIFFFPFMGAFVYTFYSFMMRSWAMMEKSTSPWMPPVYPFKTVLFICFILLLIQGISEFIKDIITIQKGSDEWIKDR